MAIASLGLAYRVGNRVRSVAAGTPAAAAGLRSGDVIVKATSSSRRQDARSPPTPHQF